MAVKKCCVNTCGSCSSRKEDLGVTYHKFPKDSVLCGEWLDVTRHTITEQRSYVCSRHFCKTDFQIYKGSKYVLKSDAIPSIFPWKVLKNKRKLNKKTITKMEVDSENLTVSNNDNETNNSINNIPKEEYPILFNESGSVDSQVKDVSVDDINNKIESILSNNEVENGQSTAEKSTSENEGDSPKAKEAEEENVAVASSVMEMILSESEAKLAKKKDFKILTNNDLSPSDKGNSMALSVGSKVEAKDFGEDWYPAQIMEVDYDEMEVLVHYENDSKKHDEWISVSSPRLRPINSLSTTVQEGSASKPVSKEQSPAPVTVKEEIKQEDKSKVEFAVGERCLARYRDNRRFMATVSADLGEGQFEIIFDDGARWTCAMSRLCKLKDTMKKGPLTVDTTLAPSASSTPSPDMVPIGNAQPLTPHPAYHTHLFDPARDYLGSKSERRELKRKLNIKEIFNIGQKKKKVNTPLKEKSRRVVKEKKPRRGQVIRRKKSVEKVVTTNVKVEIKKEIPDAIASIIGTAETAVKKEVVAPGEKGDESESTEITYDKPVVKLEPKTDVEDALEFETFNSETLSAPETQDLKNYDDPVTEEEVKLEKFDQPEDNKHEEVIDRIKEVINKLEDGLNQAESKPNVIISPKVEIKPAIKDEVVNTADIIKPITEKVDPKDGDVKPRKDLPKVKKGKKLRLLQEKKVKKQVEKVKCELEEMKRQMAEMKRQMIEKTEQLKCKETEMPESFLLPGEWCCKWVNGQPLGTVSEVEAEAKLDANNKPILPRRSVQVEDKRLPPGWTKHMVRRSFGHSAGKWDVVMVNPENRRFHTKTDMRAYFENNDCDDLKPYENALYDFGVHLKLSRRMGWYTTTPDGLQENPIPVPADTICSSSPLVKKKNLSLRREKKERKIKKIKKEKRKEKKKKMRLKLKRLQREQIGDSSQADSEFETGVNSGVTFEDSTENQPPLEDGYVYVGSLKVQVNGTLLRCPVDGCFKNFRNNTLLKMHITHYHRQMKKMLGNTPRVLDLAYARTKPTEMEIKRMKLEAQKNTIKIKLPKLPKRYTEPKTEPKDIPEAVAEPSLPIKIEREKIPRSLDSPKLRLALANRPLKRPKVLLPVRRVEPEVPSVKEEEEDQKPIEPVVEVPPMDNLDFETEISTHTVTKPADCRRKGDKKKKFASIAKTSEEEDWSDVDTRSSFPRSGTPDSKSMDQKLHSADYIDEKQDPNYVYLEETGERIKVVRMKREEIINCHCGFREEDGLMVQCELCLCWQHAICHNIQRESEVPEKYTCSICLNPRRGRRSKRFLHDQDRLYEGLLPGAKPCETLRRSHELSGNLLRIEDALQALKVKYYVATKKDHPKLYLWAKDWEANDSSLTQERLNSDYSGLHVMVGGGVGKENMPLGSDLHAPSSDDQDQDDRLSSRLGPLSGVLGGLLGGDEPLDLPITASDLEQLADTVQDQDRPLPLPLPLPPSAPVPEPAIEDGACRERLLRHIQRCHALVDARLDSIEAQVAELESQDPSFEDDETANYFPRTKQTVQMLMRDLDTMEELGNIA